MIVDDHRRCVSCNKVSSQEIETNIGDFSRKVFVPDPVDGKQFICLECREWHDELMFEYEQKDDPYGWEEDGILDAIDLEIELEQPINDNEPIVMFGHDEILKF